MKNLRAHVLRQPKLNGAGAHELPQGGEVEVHGVIVDERGRE